jgi:hypothetical protein
MALTKELVDEVTNAVHEVQAQKVVGEDFREALILVDGHAVKKSVLNLTPEAGAFRDNPQGLSSLIREHHAEAAVHSVIAEPGWLEVAFSAGFAEHLPQTGDSALLLVTVGCWPRHSHVHVRACEIVRVGQDLKLAELVTPSVNDSWLTDLLPR